MTPLMGLSYNWLRKRSSLVLPASRVYMLVHNPKLSVLCPAKKSSSKWLVLRVLAGGDPSRKGGTD
jgi:hypothetical protein